jgi:adenylate cyclase
MAIAQTKRFLTRGQTRLQVSISAIFALLILPALGDSVMAFWGAPMAIDDHVFRACVAALRASHRMKQLNLQWANEGRRQMPVRFGVHCDTVVVGNVGSPERLSYTVMGYGVNVASRIEGLNKQFGTSICISESVHERVASRVVARALGRVPVKGRETEIMVYELLGIAGSADAELHAAQETALEGIVSVAARC